MMNPDEISNYITSTFDGVDVVVTSGTSFFFADPTDHRLPFATIVTNNDYDDGSDLDRPGVYRLNFGVGKDTFRSIFGSPAAESYADSPEPSYDLTALDRLMPHPEYGRMFWVCVLNPSPATIETLRPMLAEAYERARRRPRASAAATS
jgi:hypothetical protein